ncbi:MAG: vanadium-dependent haloperoxidase [Longimicrobiales bacterium]
MIGAACVVVAACNDSSLPLTAPDARSEFASSTSPKLWETNAALYWNDQATLLAALRPIDAVRMYSYLTLAQLQAAETAAIGNDPHPAVSGAIGGASAAVLSSLFPLDVATIEAALAAQKAADPWPGVKHADFSAGEALGRTIGAQVMVWAQSDRIGLQDPGTPPIGPGYWVWNGGPIARGNLGARPFFLATADEFRPPPPPAFGGPEFIAALAEVRQISDTRTAEQLASAQFWAVNQSPRSNAAMYDIARELIIRYRRNETESARILFLANASAFDALIGCFDAKYHYWFIRPSQADPAITLPIGLPPHPSYPSAHSCISGAMTATLADAFPSERPRLEAIALEASLSRLYAGIHYRFDMQAGLALGAAVAAKAARADLSAIGPTN